MSPSAIITAAVLLLLLSGVAFAIGFRRGKAVGWLEHHFADIAKDRARRNRLGQFKAVPRA